LRAATIGLVRPVDNGVRRWEASRRRRGLALGVLALGAGLLLFAAAVPPRAAAASLRPFVENLGGTGGPSFGNPEGLAVDQSSGDLLVIDAEAGTLSRWHADGTPADFTALGTNVIDGKGATPPVACSAPSPGCDGLPLDEGGEQGLVFGSPAEVEVAVDDSSGPAGGDIYVAQSSRHLVEVFGADGRFLGQLTEAAGEPLGEVCGVAVGPDGELLVEDFSPATHVFTPSASPVTNADNTANLETFDLPGGHQPGCAVAAGDAASESSFFAAEFPGGVSKFDLATGTSLLPVGPSESTTVAVDPGNGHVLVARGDQVVEYDASGSTEATVASSLDAGSTVQGVAVDAVSGRAYVSREGMGAISVFGPPAVVPTATTSPADGLSVSGATLHGTVDPQGTTLTACRFEYGPTTAYGSSAPCAPASGSIPPLGATEVSAVVAGLTKNATYHYRLVVENATGLGVGQSDSFTTPGEPQIEAEYALPVEAQAATLNAQVDPAGFATRYRFEWGGDTSYGHRQPVGDDALIEAGDASTQISARLEGLQPESAYHFRVVAINGSGTSAGRDQEFRTLGTSGFPDHRGIELVSRARQAPASAAGQTSLLSADLQLQPALRGSAFAYTAENGFEGVTAGGEVAYLGSRGESSWSSSQLSAPISGSTALADGFDVSSRIAAMSGDLGCGAMISNQPLASGAPPSTVESGHSNLFRFSPGGGFTTITTLPVLNLEDAAPGSEYEVFGMSPDCQRVLFTTWRRFPGIPSTGPTVLYEWRDGSLQNLGLVPDAGGGEVPVAAAPGGDAGGPNISHAVSADGSRVFFTAVSRVGGDAGSRAVFMRKGGHTIDVSQSQAAVPDSGAIYQDAALDGSKVFFTANAGLSDDSNSSGEDLYGYDLATGSLTDLSLSPDRSAADVLGVLGSSADGSRVYFAARGQLDPGRGPDLAENEAQDTYSVFSAVAGRIEYIGRVTAGDVAIGGGRPGVTVLSGVDLTSRVTPDGNHLLFESSADLTGYESGGVPEAYLFSAGRAPEDPGSTVCISCRPDGRPSLARANDRLLPNGEERSTPLQPPISLTESGAMAFFESRDYLAAGAVAGQLNLYEWEHGQVYLLTTLEPAAPGSSTVSGGRLRFGGATLDGSDVYFVTPTALDWEDTDARSDVYDLRVGGGFAPPPAVPGPCQALAEDSCQSAGAVPPAAGTAPQSSGPPGSGNVVGHRHPGEKKSHRRKRGGHRHGGRRHQGPPGGDAHPRVAPTQEAGR
jgi:hypothetical protein